MLPPELSKADLHLLYVFATVVEARGFSAAQIELNVSPSTISRQVSDLEIRLGMKLCQRGRSGFRLTEQGHNVHRAAQRLFASVREFGETVNGSRGKLVGKLCIAVIDNWVFNERSQFATALQHYVGLAPDVTIELFSLAPDDIELAVQDSRASLGIGVFHKHKPGLIYHSIGSEKVSLYCGADHPLFNEHDGAKIDEALRKSRYVKRTYLREREVAPVSRGLDTNAQAHQIEGIAHLILTGKYIGYLPEQFANVWVRDGKMRSIGDGRFDQPSEIKLVKKRGIHQNQAVQTFEELITTSSHGVTSLASRDL